MKYYFPLHFDSGNRGCEAIARSTAILLDTQKENIVSYTRNYSLDERLGLGDFMKLVPTTKDSIVIDKILGAVNRLLNTTQTRAWRNIYPYMSLFRMMEKGDVMVSTGGDMMCYEDCQAVYTNNYMHQKNVKTILWGCSMGPENLTKEKSDTLRLFSFIYTRESLTYDFLNSLGLKNICLFPDPAFILQEEPCSLPECFTVHESQYNDGVIGLNVSYIVLKNKDFGREVTKFIHHVLNDTKYRILLIPHVTWNAKDDNQDDREVARALLHDFNNNSRISILDIDNLNYCQIRYVISKCRFFLGARTHSVISAYSMCVPSIALGYSIKARGIANDLGLDNRLVVNTKDCSAGELCESFDYMVDNECSVRKHLEAIMPEYKKRTYGIKKVLSTII